MYSLAGGEKVFLVREYKDKNATKNKNNTKARNFELNFMNFNLLLLKLRHLRYLSWQSLIFYKLQPIFQFLSLKHTPQKLNRYEEIYHRLGRARYETR